jgi:hypothetical protein
MIIGINSSRLALRLLKVRRFFFVLNSLSDHVLSVNVIIVVGHEKLNVEMQRTYGSTLTVIKIPKSGGVCEREIYFLIKLAK